MFWNKIPSALASAERASCIIPSVFLIELIFFAPPKKICIKWIFYLLA